MGAINRTPTEFFNIETSIFLFPIYLDVKNGKKNPKIVIFLKKIHIHIHIHIHIYILNRDTPSSPSGA